MARGPWIRGAPPGARGPAFRGRGELATFLPSGLGAGLGSAGLGAGLGAPFVLLPADLAAGSRPWAFCSVATAAAISRGSTLAHSGGVGGDATGDAAPSALPPVDVEAAAGPAGGPPPAAAGSRGRPPSGAPPADGAVRCSSDMRSPYARAAGSVGPDVGRLVLDRRRDGLLYRSGCLGRAPSNMDGRAGSGPGRTAGPAARLRLNFRRWSDSAETRMG